MRKKILVTGGAGYIGSHTVIKLFLSGYMPIIVDNLCNTSKRNLIGINKILNTNITFHKLDCTDLKQMGDIFKIYKDIFACIHFSAFKSISDSFENPQKYHLNNIGSTEVLLKCLDKNKFKNLIFSSSCTVYGTPSSSPINECTPFNKAESPYAETKQKCEFLIKNSKCNTVSLRYFNPIGSHDSTLIGDCSSDMSSNLVPIIAEVAAGSRKELIINGTDYDTRDGTCIRDYVHVEDVALAHIKALDYLKSNSGKSVFNVGTGNGLSVLDIINAFEEVNNLKVNYVFGPRRRGDIDKIYSDGKKIKTVLGWEPTKTTKEALLSAWKWQVSVMKN